MVLWLDIEVRPLSGGPSIFRLLVDFSSKTINQIIM